MSAQKLVICLVIAVIAVITSEVTSTSALNAYASNGNKSHHLVIGYRMAGDMLVLKENVIKQSSWMKVVIVEKTFNASRWDRITQVSALDQKTNGNGAYASLLKGGPGYNNVTLRFKSQRGHGINFVVELYARP